MVQSTTHTETTRLLASLHSVCFLWWLSLVTLRRLLLLRFLVVPRFRCYSVTVNRSSFKPPLPHNQDSFAACSMHHALFLVSPPIFSQNLIRDALAPP